MKTTLELPDQLFRTAKATAAERGRTLKEFMTEAVRESCRRATDRRRTRVDARFRQAEAFA